VLTPSGEETVPVLLVEVASVGEEGGGEEHVPFQDGHLQLDVVRGQTPAVILNTQALQEAHAAVHLGSRRSRKEVGAGGRSISPCHGPAAGWS